MNVSVSVNPEKGNYIGLIIVDYAKKNRVDLIIMGSNGLEGLAKIKGWGSVSRKVSERVSCPITIIR